MATDPLDVVAWSSLTGDHRHLAVINAAGTAAKYRKDVGLFGAMAVPDQSGWQAAAELTRDGGIFGVFQADVEAPTDPQWEVLFSEPVDQFVAGTMRAIDAEPLADGAEIVPLGEPHVEDMVALTKLTEPGPFKPGTISMGDYFGILHGGRLLAMAGQRFRPEGYIEVSAVCTHPDGRRRGYGAALTRYNVDRIRAEGREAILHTRWNNDGARRLYEAMGFRFRRKVDVVVARRLPAD
ncbi:MAG: GNAT family N-acetyltransferase [Actinomycetota bacterium]